jgi:two-component system LytT family response regulator
MEQESDVKIVGEASTLAEGAELMAKKLHDAVFLDIKLQRDDGFDLFRSLDDQSPVVIVTAFPNFAVQAFDVRAVDFLLKPVSPKRLSVAIERIRSKVPSESIWQRRDQICFKTSGKTIIAYSEVIISLEADGDFTRITFVDEKPIMICHNLSYYERILPNPPFLRVDRSLIINLDKVKKLESDRMGHEFLTLSGMDKTFILGRNAKRRLNEALGEH